MEMDGTESDPNERLPQGAADAYAAAAGADTSEIEGPADAEEAPAEAAPDEDVAAEGDEPTSEPDVEAAADEGEGPTPDAEFDADDPSTWPDEIRAEHEKYKGSAYELAKAALEQRRTFGSELERRLAEVTAERTTDAARKPVETPAEAPVPTAQMEAITRETNALADQYDADLARRTKIADEYSPNLQRLGKLDALIEHYESAQERAKASGDDLALSDVTQQLDEFTRERDRRSNLKVSLEAQDATIVGRMERAASRNRNLKERLGEEIKRTRAVEEDQRASELRTAKATKGFEREISSTLDQTARKLGVPDSDRKRFDYKLLRALNGEPNDPKNLAAFFETEGRAEMSDTARAKASGVASYASAKRADVARPAPSGVAKATNAKPMTRQEADRLAARASRSIPIG
jgi:hypothetical protein